MTKPHSPAGDGFTQSAGRQLAAYALAAVAVLAGIMTMLSLALGDAGGAGGGAVDFENNSITITLRQEPPQLYRRREFLGAWPCYGGAYQLRPKRAADTRSRRALGNP